MDAGILTSPAGGDNTTGLSARGPWRRILSGTTSYASVTLLFLGLAAVVTFPQVLHLGTAVPFHSDPYFSIWRLGWAAHAIRTDPRHLFEANIFFPAHDTFAYSDPMLLPAAVLAPLFWASANPVAIYNISLLTAMALSGVAVYALSLHLTGCRPAALVGGAIYAFAPYRFDHYMHFELQVVFWIPLALLALHRLAERPRIRDGVWLGMAMAAQVLSCVYLAIFGTVYCAVVAATLAMSAGTRVVRSALVPLVIGAAITLAVAVPYSKAFIDASRSVGTRTLDDIAHYGATLANYRAAPPMNRLYGSVTSASGADELYLFPGIAAIVLAALGITRSRGTGRLAYVAALIAAFELSRGLNGFGYEWLVTHVAPFRALRAPSRIGILVVLSLAVLSAHGVAWIHGRLGRSWQRACGPLLLVLVVIEYASAPTVAPVPAPTLVDSWLARQPPLTLVQLPLPSADTNGQSRDWVYMYQALPHFQRMLNGYSGYAPGAYYEAIAALRAFPDDRSIAYLRAQHISHVVLRARYYSPERWETLVSQTRARPDLTFTGGFLDRDRVELVFEVGTAKAP